MIRVEGLTKYYGSTLGVDNVSFHLEKGATLGLLGPNGAGKSTIIRMLAGTLQPTEGRVIMTGSLADPASLEYKKHVGYLPETAPLYSPMPVDRYLRFVAQVKGIPAKEQRESLERVLSQCQLEAVADRVIGKLSKGFRQRVGLAQALINDPSLLILDEPTAGLDPQQTSAFRKVIRSMQGRRTVLLSTHILPEVRSLCNRVIIINRGKIAAQGEIDGLLARDPSRQRIHLEIRGPSQEVLPALEGLQGVGSVTLARNTGKNQFTYLMISNHIPDPRDQLVQLIAEHEWQLLELRPDYQELESLFLDAITGTMEDEGIQFSV